MTNEPSTGLGSTTKHGNAPVAGVEEGLRPSSEKFPLPTGKGPGDERSSKESKWLWLVYLPYLALFYWLGFVRFHNKETVTFFILFLGASFGLAPLFRFAYRLEQKRKESNSSASESS